MKIRLENHADLFLNKQVDMAYIIDLDKGVPLEYNLKNNEVKTVKRQGMKQGQG